MTGLFIAHAPADQARAGEIAKALRDAGFTVESGGDLTAVEALRASDLGVVLWSRTSVDSGPLIDLAEAARGDGKYLGVLIDQVELPFGFGGYTPLKGAGNVAATVDGIKRAVETGGSEPEALPPPPPPPKPPFNFIPYVLGGGGLILAAVIAFFLFRSTGPSTEELIGEQLATTPCAWLRVDPVVDGSNGTLGLIGAAGDPAAAGKKIEAIVAERKMNVQTVSIERVAQIDPRECAAIDGLRTLRKTAGGRLGVSGEPFILDSSLKKPQALTRVNIALKGEDKTMALFGVEPSGVVTWALPDLETLESLTGKDVGLTKPGAGRYEFSIYPDHLGWTGLFIVVGDGPLAAKMPPGKVQSSAEFAKTLKAATASGKWDADMVWFKIDPKQ